VAAVVAAASPYAAQIDGGRRLSGSGTVFAGDGVIVAASHNVERDEDVVVGLEGGKRLPATLVGRDSSTDLAVLRVEASGLAAPQWSDLAGLAVGQLAVLVGRPGRQVRAVLEMTRRGGAASRAAWGWTRRADRWASRAPECCAGAGWWCRGRPCGAWSSPCSPTAGCAGASWASGPTRCGCRRISRSGSASRSA
jgi:hypothetical protein